MIPIEYTIQYMIYDDNGICLIKLLLQHQISYIYNRNEMRISSQSYMYYRRRWVREHSRKRVAPVFRHGLRCGAQATGVLEVSTCMCDENGQYPLCLS